ncbi:MAG TPA: hypothetical protein VIC63_03595 [Candidatus Limnocylindria bacterium]|jgi:hypothetical protein
MSPALHGRCINHDASFSVPYPADWWVHPADPDRDIAECERFGPEPFELILNNERIWEGHSIGMEVGTGCIGSFWEPASAETRLVGGRTASRVEYLPGVGNESPTYPTLTYFVPLVANVECEQGENHWFWAATAGGFSTPVGDYEENKAILDAMMGGLEFSATP